MDAIQQIRNQAHPSFFMELAILMCWSIRTVRNNSVLQVQPNIHMAKEVFQKELNMLVFRVKTNLSVTFDLWS
jgi:hypothetical protein